MNSNFPHPPADMVMPQTAQAVFTIALAILVCLALLAAAVTWRRSGSPIPLLLLGGGAAAMFGEPVGDILQTFWFPRINQWRAFETFGRPIPAWAALAYPLYYGVLAWIMLAFVRRGVTRRSFWHGFVLLLGLDSVLQVAFLSLDVGTYYGNHALMIAGFPPAFQFVNLLAPIGSAVILVRFNTFFTGHRMWMIVPMIPAIIWSSWIVGLPASSTLATNHEGVVPLLGALATITLGLGVLDTLAKAAAGCAPAGGMVPDDGRTVVRVDAA